MLALPLGLAPRLPQGEEEKPAATTSVVCSGELGHMHPREREVRMGKCPELSCLYYSAHPGLRLPGAGWGDGRGA